VSAASRHYNLNAANPLIILALAEPQVLLPSKIPSIAQERQDAVLVHRDFKVDNRIYGCSGKGTHGPKMIKPSSQKLEIIFFVLC
jgi:hypothetical protein